MKKQPVILAFAILFIGFALIFCNGCKKDVSPVTPPVQNGIDTTRPTLSLFGASNIDIVLNSANFIDPGCTAFDNIDGDITPSIIITGSVNTNLAGIYVLSYSATDSSGNQNSVQRYVRVYNQAENLQGNYNVNDSTAGAPNIVYTETITPSTTINNRVLFSKFAANANCSVYGNKVGLTMSIPSQTVLNTGNPPADRTFTSISSSIVYGTNTTMYIYYSEITNGITTYGKGTYTKL
ncbi:MAG: DUF5011 domain-containing protein [Bacteroidota bacterium]